MIEIEAEVRVYLVNKIVCSFSNVSKRIKIEILKPGENPVDIH